jgi:lysophospholipase-2
MSPDDPSKHSASIILCHGLGDTADGWVDPARVGFDSLSFFVSCEHMCFFMLYLRHSTPFLQYLASKLPHVKFILPTAPTQPVTLNMGFAMPSWYDIVGLDSRSNELCEGLDESMDKIMELISHEVGPDGGGGGIDYSRIVLAGFSQGGALALYTGMTCTRRGEKRGLGLAGIVIMSGYLPRASSFQIAAGSQSTPILHCHGRQDPMVLVDAVEMSKNRVLTLANEMGGGDNNSYQTKIYPGLEHSVSMEELDDVAQFLERVLPTKTSDGEL